MAVAMAAAVTSEPSAGGLLDEFFAAVAVAGERDALVLLEQCRRRCDAAEAQVLAGRVSAGDERGAKRLLRSVGLSRQATGRRVGRAKVVEANPTVGERLAAGVVSAEQVDVIATADRSTDGAASGDAAFVDEVLGSSPDAGPNLKKQWLANRRSTAEVEARYRRQRAGRQAWLHQTDDGLRAITIAGDDSTVDRLWTRAGQAADRGYRHDGGRDVDPADHARTYPQRLFDAFADLIDGKPGAGRSSRPSVVFSIGIENLLDRSRASLGAEQIGTGPVADDVILDVLKDADLWTLLAEPSGHPLWMGRGARNATKAQLVAMIWRDRGCVETGDHWSRTHAHHNTGWHAPARGRTDVDQMALVSETVHRDLHSTNETFEYDPKIRKWRRRKAKPHEQSPRRPDRAEPDEWVWCLGSGRRRTTPAIWRDCRFTRVRTARLVLRAQWGWTAQ